MSNIYVKSILFFKPDPDKAPDWVKANVKIDVDAFLQFINDHAEYLTYYNNKTKNVKVKQLPLVLVDGKYGLSLKIDDYKSGPVDQPPVEEDLPF